MIKTDTGQNLLRYNLNNYKFLCYDYETESLCLVGNNKPWEVGYITVEGGKVTSEHNRNIWWEDLNISDDASRITRFNYENYKKDAEDPDLVLKDFESKLYDPKTINITYNGLNFDMYLHQLWRKKLGKDIDWTFLPRSIDILALSRAYRMGMEPPEDWENFFCCQFTLANYFSDSRTRASRKLPSCTLKKMCEELDIEFDDGQAHGGLYDVHKTWEVFKQLIRKMEITTKHLYI